MQETKNKQTNKCLDTPSNPTEFEFKFKITQVRSTPFTPAFIVGVRLLDNGIFELFFFLTMFYQWCALRAHTACENVARKVRTWKLTLPIISETMSPGFRVVSA